jgi:hypothetical protein
MELKAGVKDGVDDSSGIPLRAVSAFQSLFAALESNQLTASNPGTKKASPRLAKKLIKTGVKDGIRTRGLLDHNQDVKYKYTNKIGYNISVLAKSFPFISLIILFIEQAQRLSI